VKVGKANIHLVSDGVFRLDGGALFGVVPKALWRPRVRPDRKNRITMGLNCLLIQSGAKNILVDTGVGTKLSQRRKSIYGVRAGRLLKGLKDLGLEPQDIHLVVLTHLHFDHAGGCTYIDSSGRPVPTFPRAVYLIQRAEWNEATHTNELTKASYLLEDFLPIENHRQLKLLVGDTEVAPEVWVELTGGHTGGHQVVLVKSEGATAAYLGDILPTPHHMPLPYITAMDLEPLVTLRAKRELLEQAEREGWLLLFGHGLEQQAGRLERSEGKLVLKSA